MLDALILGILTIAFFVIGWWMVKSPSKRDDFPGIFLMIASFALALATLGKLVSNS